VSHYSGTSVESDGHFQNRRENNFAKDLVRRVTPKCGSYITAKKRGEGEKEWKNKPNDIYMPGSCRAKGGKR